MAKPKLCLIPASQGSKLFSVLPSSGVGDFTFTRSGSATRINSQGLIETVANGVSRLNYPLIDGKVVGCPHHILEPQRTNLITYSEDFSDAGWYKLNSVTVSDNEEISPDGTLNASLINSPNTSNNLINNSISVSVNTDYTFSVFIKKDNNESRFPELFLRFYTSGGNAYEQYTQINTKTGITNVREEFGVNSNTVEDYGDYWRLSLTTNSNTQTDCIFGFNSAKSNVFGTSNQQVGSAIIFGAQLEQGSFPTSYIPTNGESGGVTRSAETANGSGDATTFNDSEGVLMTEISALSDDSTNRIFGISNNSNFNESILLRYSNNSNEIIAQVRKGGVYEFSMTHTLNDSTLFSKIAFKYKQNDFSLFVNGFEVDTSPTGDIITGLDTLSLSYVGGNQFYGNTKQIQYYNSVLTDSELEQLTSWTSFTDMANGQQYSII